MKERKLDEQLYIDNWPVPSENLAALVRLIDQGTISGKIAKLLFEEMLTSGRPPQEIVREKGLEQVSDAESIEKAIEQVLRAYPKQVEQYREGNEKVFGFLVGQVMKATQGKINPQKANGILKQKLAGSK